MSATRHNWQCSSLGPQNNNMVGDCGFTFYFDDNLVRSLNCPICGSSLRRIPAENSVANLLRRGLEEEKKQ